MKKLLRHCHRGWSWILASLVLALAVAPGLSFAETITYFYNDLLGSPVTATTNNSTVVTWRESYGPYGDRQLLQSASAKENIWFTSRHEDGNTELVYMGARYYDPMVGRFLATDPRRFNGGDVHSFNRYVYANNNPYRYIDLDGRSPISFLVWQVVTRTGAGWAAGTLADGISQYAAFGSLDQVSWSGAATSDAAAAGGAAGLFSVFLPQASTVKTAGQLGREGEQAVRAAFDIGESRTIVVNGISRKPDGLTEAVLSEIKNTKYQALTAQLRDYLQYAQQNGLQFDLYVRQGAKLSSGLQDAIDAGLINLRQIPAP